ncbi:hypothetical protein QJS10_CPB17g01500 [Acorus calamus]|uniref:Uncharacterized protein n=1 Tax=Acorus calamus TaxID=4465 RepID=A0AAV9CXZ2_ACOCL|nr:hypothetical protein QJS10_CPB17g01500 [Acorus calamus]
MGETSDPEKGKAAKPSPTLTNTASLSQLLPTGTVFMFQALSSPFSNYGQCYTSNKYLTLVLIILCTVSCIFFSFTDSFIHDGKHYYGIATINGFWVFNANGSCGEYEKKRLFGDYLQRYRIRSVDFVHSIFSVLLFWTISCSDSDIQHCFLPEVMGGSAKELVKNLPLGVGFVSALVFSVFPTSRKGIGYSQ